MESSVILAATASSPFVGYVVIAALIVFWVGTIVWGRTARVVTDVGVDRDLVIVSLFSPARLLSLRGKVAFPLDTVISVKSTPNIFSKNGSFSRRLGGVTLPTFFRVGSFRGFRDQGPSFWACFRGENTITFELENFRYRYVVVDVADPQATLGMLSKHGL